MSDDPVLQAVQKFMDAVEARLQRHSEEIRAAVTDLQTRTAPQAIEGAPGTDGKDGTNGVDGKDGKDGTQGERGADGIATIEELEAAVEKRFADVQVRTFADTYQGVYKPDQPYLRGTLTTWGGSLWLSLADTQRKPGEQNPDWKLVVKK